MDKLNNFSRDKILLNLVKDYLFTHLKQTALDRVFNGKDIVGLKEAGEMVARGFDKMEVEFTDKVEKKLLNESI